MKHPSAPITLASIRNAQRLGELDQELANEGKVTLDDLRLMAERSVGADRFPQYRGHFASFELVTITSSVRTKLGQAFKRGDRTLARWEDSSEDRPAGGWVAFSFRNGCDTAVGLDAKRA